MVDFAETLNVVAVIFEILWKSDDVGDCFAEVGDQVVDAGGVGACAGEEAGAAGGTDGLLAVGAVKNDAGGSDAVDVRGVDVGAAVAVEFRAQVVDGDE